MDSRSVVAAMTTTMTMTTATTLLAEETTVVSSLAHGFTSWLFKTRMSFYADDQLQLPWWFGLCCWNFAVAGVCMLWTEPRRTTAAAAGGGRSRAPQFPYRLFAWLLILVQSPLSFLADYVSMTHDSYWHVLDRLCALPLMGLEVWKVAMMMYECFGKTASTTTTTIHPRLCLLYGLATCCAVLSFFQSTAAQAALNRGGFVFWHNTWHAYPLVVSSIVVYDFYALEGWKRSARQYFYALEWHLLKKAE